MGMSEYLQAIIRHTFPSLLLAEPEHLPEVDQIDRRTHVHLLIRVRRENDPFTFGVFGQLQAV